jgi:hypothetical protein
MISIIIFFINLKNDGKSKTPILLKLMLMLPSFFQFTVHKVKSKKTQKDLEEHQELPEWGKCPICLRKLHWPLKHIREVHQLDSTMFSNTVKEPKGCQAQEEKAAVLKAISGYQRKVIFFKCYYNKTGL